MNTHAFRADAPMATTHSSLKSSHTGRASMQIAMTDWFIVLATALSAFFLSDPIYGGWMARSIFAKVLTFGAVTVALALHLFARAVFASEVYSMSVRQVLSRWYPLIILALFIIAGSIYGSKVEHHKSTFLNFGLGMLFLPTVAIAISCSENKLGLLKWLGVVYVLMVLTILIEMPITKATHHEEIFVAVPLGLYFLSAVKPKFWEILIGLALVGVCGFSVKNTTFIMMVAVLMLATFLWIFRFMRMRDKLKATFVSLLAMVLSGGLVAAAALVWYKYKDKLPHGNTEYRAEMYRIAWGKFIKSPIWGNGFTGETVSYFGLYKVDMATSYLPTHSDIIDIMANGGAIGLFLWFVAVMNVLFFLVTAFSKLSKRTSLLHEERWRWLFVAATYSLCAVITYAVNPPLINPVHGYWIWGGLGVTWVLWHDLTKTELARVRK